MHRNQKIESTKDFKGSLIRLFINLDKWRVLMIISIVLALFAAILSTIAPNKLADVTDVITVGIKPRVENIELISKEIISHSNINENYISNTNKEFSFDYVKDRYT